MRAVQWEFTVALAIAIPIILFPAAFIWYLNLGGIYHAIQDARKRRAAREQRTRAVAEAEQHITVAAAKEKSVEKELVETKH